MPIYPNPMGANAGVPARGAPIGRGPSFDAFSALDPSLNGGRGGHQGQRRF
jgi:hypothetical protein